MAKREMAGARREAIRRFIERRQKVVQHSKPELIPNEIERLVVGLLEELGIDHPIDFHSPGPDVVVSFRQGTFQLAPEGQSESHSFTGSTPSEGGFVIFVP